MLSDLEVLASLRHPNLLRYHTQWMPSPDQVVLITDLLPTTTLDHHLKKIKQPRLKRIRIWAMQLLSVLDYLHSLPKPIVHGDLTPEKIYVVNSTGDLKVGGIGVGRCFLHKTVSLPITPFTAPESFSSNLAPNTDIYAFGMCLLEICTLEKPYNCCSNTDEVAHKATQGVLPMSLGRIEDMEIRSLIRLCISSEAQRPSASRLLTHPFFSTGDDDERMKLPIKLRAVPAFESWEEPKTSEKSRYPRTINISLTIPGDNDEPQKVDFEYDLVHDTPETIACEMMKELGVKKSYEQKVVQLIREQVNLRHRTPKGMEEPAERKMPYPEPTVQRLDESTDISPDAFVRKSHRKFSRREADDTMQFVSSCTSPGSSTPSSLRAKRIPSTPMQSTRISLDQENQQVEVRLIQQALNMVLKLRSPIDGIFSKLTEGLVRKYQENIGHIVDGIVTRKLWDMLIIQFEVESDTIQIIKPRPSRRMSQEEQQRESRQVLDSLEKRLLNNPLA